MDKPISTGQPRRQSADLRWSVASRVLAAVLGGYALTNLVIVTLSLAWPGNPARAVLGASLLGFLIYAGIVMWVFAVRTAKRAWLGLLLASGGLGILALLLKLQEAV